MLAALINNAMRAMMADVAAWRDATSGVKSTTGSANAYVLSTGMGLTALAAGERLTAKVNFTNSGSATLAVDGQAATAIHLVSGSALAGGELTGIHDFAFDGTYWQVLNPSMAASQPLDATLTALAAFNTNGVLVQTAADTFAGRTITGTANQIAVTNGDGVAGAPTLALAATLALRALIVQMQDTNFTISASGDATKLVAFLASGLTTGNTRTLTVQDASGTIGLNDVEGQTVAGGGIVTSKSLGTVTSGTTTLSMGARPLQHYTNGGAHTLAPGTDAGACIVDITNNGSAGAITTSGWTKVSGSFDTTSGHKFRCHCSVGNAGCLLVVQALQ